MPRKPDPPEVRAEKALARSAAGRATSRGLVRPPLVPNVEELRPAKSQSSRMKGIPPPKPNVKPLTAEEIERGRRERQGAGRKMTNEGSNRVIELICAGKSDEQIIAVLRAEQHLSPDDQLSHRMLLFYRAKPEAFPDIKYMTRRAQQMGTYAYSETLINTVLLAKASIRALLTSDTKTGDPKLRFATEESFSNREGFPAPIPYDGKMIKALMDGHFKSQEVLIKLFTPDTTEDENENDIGSVIEHALVTMAEELAASVQARQTARQASRDAGAARVARQGVAAPTQAQAAPVGERSDYIEIGNSDVMGNSDVIDTG